MEHRRADATRDGRDADLLPEEPEWAGADGARRCHDLRPGRRRFEEFPVRVLGEDDEVEVGALEAFQDPMEVARDAAVVGGYGGAVQEDGWAGLHVSLSGKSVSLRRILRQT
jgi:hypothetical protein